MADNELILLDYKMVNKRSFCLLSNKGSGLLFWRTRTETQSGDIDFEYGAFKGIDEFIKMFELEILE